MSKQLTPELRDIVMECAELYHEAYGQAVGQKAIDTWQTSNEPELTIYRLNQYYLNLFMECVDDCSPLDKFSPTDLINNLKNKLGVDKD